MLKEAGFTRTTVQELAHDPQNDYYVNRAWPHSVSGRGRPTPDAPFIPDHTGKTSGRFTVTIRRHIW